MLKFLLILILFFYVFYKVGGFIMKALYFGSGRQFQQRQQYQQQYQRGKTTYARNGEVKVDYVPDEEIKKRKSSNTNRGGEYVDYEEVK